MRIQKLIALTCIPLALAGACGSDDELGDITIEICPTLLTATENVELVVARPEGFSMELPPGARLEEVDGQSPAELVWQVPQPSDGWREFQTLHLNHTTGTEMVAVRVSYGGGNQALSDTQSVTDGLRLPVCLPGADAGVVVDAGAPDGPMVDTDATDSDAGILQNDIQITNNAVGAAHSPSMVSNGTGLAVAWVDSRHGDDEIYFARLNAAGGIVGSEVRVTNDGAMSNAPSLIWTGAEYGLAWYDNRSGDNEIYFIRISNAGVVQGTPTRVTTSSGTAIFPSLAHDGTRYAVAWEDTRDGPFQMYLTFLTNAGVEINDDIRLTMTTEEAAAVSLLWNGAEYGLSWQDKRDGPDLEIYFARYDSDGVLIGSETRITDTADRSSIPSLTWDDTGYAIAWEDSRSGVPNTYFVQVSAAGAKIGTEISVSSSNSLAVAPDLLWTGSQYALAWSDLRTGNGEIMFAEIASNGIVTGTPGPITVAPDSSSNPSLAEVSMETKAIWSDRRLGDAELFFQAPVP